MGRERLETEFDLYARWLAEAIAGLPEGQRIPAACRGTGNPALLETLADALGVGPNDLVLDAGSGIGGPGAWLASERGCNVVAVDVMAGGIEGLRRLFPLPAVVASTRSLPFPDGRFDAVWALGVLETIADKPGAVREMARVLAPGGRFAAYDLVPEGAPPPDSPEADRFEGPEPVAAAIAGAGLAIVRSEAAELTAPPPGWQEAAVRARAEVERCHGADPRLATVTAELDKISRITRGADVTPWLFIAQKPLEEEAR